jgi:hypothetical protein
VDPVGSALIDFVETAYNLELEQHEWLPKLLDAWAPAVEHGLGFLALTCARPPEPGPLVIDQLHVASGPGDLLEGMGTEHGAALAPESSRHAENAQRSHRIA